eukprot:3601564-Rhodomonas_salina.1
MSGTDIAYGAACQEVDRLGKGQVRYGSPSRISSECGSPNAYQCMRVVLRTRRPRAGTEAEHGVVPGVRGSGCATTVSVSVPRTCRRWSTALMYVGMLLGTKARYGGRCITVVSAIRCL